MTFPTSIENSAYFGVAYNNLSTTLTVEASATDTTIYVTSTTNFGSIGWFAIDDEIIYHTGATSGSFTGCTRGADNTTAAVHASGATVSLTFPAIMWTRAIAEVRAALTKIGTDSDVNTASIDYLVKNTNPNATTFSHASGIKLNVITERTATSGVTVDGVLIKDDLDTSGIVGKTTTQTLTNKRITKREVTVTSSATPTPNSDITDIYTVTALAEAATFGAPTGTPTQGQTLIIRILDNGTARALSFNAAYRFSTDLAAPTTTVISKTIYLGFAWNVQASKWDCLAILNNF